MQKQLEAGAFNSFANRETANGLECSRMAKWICSPRGHREHREEAREEGRMALSFHMPPCFLRALRDSVVQQLGERTDPSMSPNAPVRYPQTQQH